LENGTDARKDLARSLSTIAMVNALIWAISIIALIFVMQRSPAAKGLFPILAGGVAVSGLLVSLVWKHR